MDHARSALRAAVWRSWKRACDAVEIRAHAVDVPAESGLPVSLLATKDGAGVTLDAPRWMLTEPVRELFTHKLAVRAARELAARIDAAAGAVPVIIGEEDAACRV